MIIVGSFLLNRLNLLSPSRLEKWDNKTSDIDVIVPTLIDSNSIKALHERNIDVLINKEVHDTLIEAFKFLPHEVVALTLKLSHMHYDLPSWHKHLHDIMYISSLGYKPDNELLYKLKTLWTEFYKGKEKIKLNKKPKDFFKASYNQNHDKLHEHFKITNIPIYKKFLKEGFEVVVDKNRLDKLLHIEKVFSVIEESMVVAYERDLSLINGFKHVYTKLSKNWWNDFITINFVEIIKVLDEFKLFYKDKKHDIHL